MKDNYNGMTVNERLYVGGFLNEFDKAVLGKNIDSVKEILRKVNLSDENIIDVLKSLDLV